MLVGRDSAKQKTSLGEELRGRRSRYHLPLVLRKYIVSPFAGMVGVLYRANPRQNFNFELWNSGPPVRFASRTLPAPAFPPYLKPDAGDRVQGVEKVEAGSVEPQRLPYRDGGKPVARPDQVGAHAGERGVLADEGFVDGPGRSGGGRKRGGSAFCSSKAIGQFCTRRFSCRDGFMTSAGADPKVIFSEVFRKEVRGGGLNNIWKLSGAVPGGACTPGEK